MSEKPKWVISGERADNNPCFVDLDYGDKFEAIAEFSKPELAASAVACVNACQGIENPEYITGVIEELEVIKDELGSAEWGSDEHGAEMFADLIRRRHDSIRHTLARLEDPK